MGLEVVVVGNILKENDGIITKGMGDGVGYGKQPIPPYPSWKEIPNSTLDDCFSSSLVLGTCSVLDPLKEMSQPGHRVSGTHDSSTSLALPSPSLFLTQTTFNLSLMCPSSPITTCSHISWLAISLSIQGHETQVVFAATSLFKPHVLSPYTSIFELTPATRQRAYLNHKETET